MLNLESIGTKDIQTVIHILQESASAGIDSNSLLRDKLYEILHDRMADGRLSDLAKLNRETGNVPSKHQNRNSLAIECPSCGKGPVIRSTILGEQGVEELVITCKSCRWSKYIGGVK